MGDRMKYVIYCVISISLLKTSDSAVIQALIDFDESSEDLIGSLISRVDNIIDPVKNDARNVSLSLAHALLKLGPTLSITGNVSDGTNSITLTFSFSATADSPPAAISHKQEEDLLFNRRGGVFEPVVGVVEPWVLFILEVAAHSILGVIVTQILQATALLENVPFS